MFDKVNHYGLFIKLMNRCVPLVFINVLIHWYGLCVAMVRWNNVFSNEFYLQCGVTQGGVLSPVLFAVYVNSIIEQLSSSGHGCHMGNVFLACVMYGDDLLLISASLYDLQQMIDLYAIEAG